MDTYYDYFIYRSTNDSTLTHTDVIENFSGSYDKLDFDDIDANTTADYDQDFTFTGPADFSGVAGQLRYAFVGNTTLVLGDTDGNSLADFAISIKGFHALVTGSFYL